MPVEVNKNDQFRLLELRSINEAKNLRNIKKELSNKGYNIPLIADIKLHLMQQKLLLK